MTKTATTTVTTTTITEVELRETLSTNAADLQSVETQFESPASATIVFTGDASGAFSGAALTTISTTRVTKVTTVTEMYVTRTSPAGTTTTASRPTVTSQSVVGPTIVTTTSDPNSGLAGYVSVEAIVDTASDYTFRVLGGPDATITVQYATDAGLDAPLDYDLGLINDATDAPVGDVDWVGPDAEGTAAWTVSSPGTYSLIVGQYSDVAAFNTFPATEAESVGATSQGMFNVSISVDPPGAGVSELPTLLMSLCGFAGLGWLAMSRSQSAASPAH